LEVDDVGNPTFHKKLLQARDSLPSLQKNVAHENIHEPNVFNDNNEERWELQHSSSEDRSDQIMNQDSEITDNIKTPFSKNVKIQNGGYLFQIELMDILQRHKTDLKMHDEIVTLLDDYLRNGKINADRPGLCTRKKYCKG